MKKISMLLVVLLLCCTGCSSSSGNDLSAKRRPDDSVVKELIYDLASNYETDADGLEISILSLTETSDDIFEVTAEATYRYFTMTKSSPLKTTVYRDTETKQWFCEFYSMFESPFYGDTTYDFSLAEGIWRGTASDVGTYEYEGKPFELRIENTTPVVRKGDTYVDGSITISHNFASLHGSKELEQYGISYGDGTTKLESEYDYRFKAEYPLTGVILSDSFTIVVEEGGILLKHPLFGNQYLQPAS